MNGNELWDKINKIMPGIKTLFISSKTLDDPNLYGIKEESVHFLQKPFTISHLDYKVKKVMGDIDS